MSHPEHSPEPAKKISRRDVLKGIGAAAIGASVGGFMANEVRKTTEQMDAKVAAAEHTDTNEGGHNPEHEGDLDFDKLNRETAMPVTAAFMGYIADGATGGSFGPRSAVVLNSLEGLRLATLVSKGGELGKHVAEHELHENTIAAGIALGLVGISDFTTTSVQLDSDTLFAKAHEIIEQDDAVIERPAIDAPLEQWEAYKESLNTRLVENITELQAITSILAPFLTTYTSSAIANEMKQGFIPTLYEQSYAREVLQARKANPDAPVQVEAIQAAAIAQTNELMNGPWGLTNLETTLAANIQGGVLAGDPPQAFGVANHFGNWNRLAKGEAFGAANDAVMTYGLTALWLKQADALPVTDVHALGSAFMRSYERASKVFSGVSLGSPDREKVDALHSAAQALNNTGAEAAVIANKMLHLSVGDYARKKLTWMRTVAERNIPGLAGILKKMKTQSAVVDASGVNSAAVFRDMVSGKGSDIVRDIEAVTSEGDELGAFFDGVLDEVDAATFDENAFAPQPSDPLVAEAAITDLRKKVEAASEVVESNVNAGNTVTQEDLTQEGVANVSEDVQALEAKLTTEQQTEAIHLISHAGKEVLWALTSQMPAVGPTAVLAEQGIAKAFTLAHGSEKSSVIAAATAAFASEAVMSSLADNVAAYMYAEKVLTGIVTKVYGADVVRANPIVGDVIYATSIKLAEQAGALTKLGNGPNFSQRKYEISATTGAEYAVTETDLPFELYTNRYAVVANSLLLAGSVAWFSRSLNGITPAPSPEPHATPAH